MSTEDANLSPAATTNADGNQAADTGKPANAPAGDTTLLTDGQTPPADGGAAPAPELNEDGTPKVATAPAPVVPEAYVFDMPEGITLDSAAAEKFSAVAKDLKLTQEQASNVAKVAVEMRQREAEAHVATVASWVEAVNTDKELGGDKLQATLARCRTTVDTFGTPALKELFVTTGLGNHPEFVRFTEKIGRLLSEDVFIKGGNTGAADTGTAESRRFPTMQS